MLIKVIIKEPGKPATVTTTTPALKEYQSLVGGYIESIPFPNINNIGIIVNEEGKFKGLSLNFYLPEYDEVVTGTAVIVGVRGADFASIPDKKIKNIIDYLKENDIWEY